MKQSDEERLAIAARLKALRERLRLRPADLVRRSEKTLSHPEWSKIERGERSVHTARKRAILAKCFGVEPRQFELFLVGIATVEEIVKLVAGEIPPLLSPVDASETVRAAQRSWGDGLATLTQLAHVNRSPFPNLELTLLYHSVNSGRVWRPDTVAAARACHFGDADVKPDEWVQRLDLLERKLSGKSVHA